MRYVAHAHRRRWPGYYWLPIVFGAIVTLTAAILLVVVRSNAEAARSWPSTTGRIETTAVRTVRGRYADSYEPHVEYSYAVAGHVYRSAQISWAGHPTYSRYADAADALARRFVPGQSVRVYYAPDDPANAILDQDNYYLAPFVMLPFGLLLLGGGLLARRRAKRSSGPADRRQAA